MRTLTVIFLLLAIPALSGSVYISSNTHGAKKVYITKNRSEAQMFVYFVRDRNQATKSCLWYKVSDRNQAQWVISYVQDRNKADLIIYIVHDKNDARTSPKR